MTFDEPVRAVSPGQVVALFVPISHAAALYPTLQAPEAPGGVSADARGEGGSAVARAAVEQGTDGEGGGEAEVAYAEVPAPMVCLGGGVIVSTIVAPTQAN